ncbi:hypothetical protein AWB72_05657 [Caballeronia concitans]|uniref:Uncharacterized protein n=1 Tax=Caballeronia concitans TaxID=1777133 RepID=A0A658R5L7_9BURK|nr:hypothetical protein AWB72_05657 [Caballeronia concitans]
MTALELLQTLLKQRSSKLQRGTGSQDQIWFHGHTESHLDANSVQELPFK